ncbi:carbonic anhydrase [Leeia sp. TBRC 13508]|uniref:Carbonic anhydrase n=1 Tax=Leeia speluncae TaxID=2884804 RepID=A0ABS8D8N6_9NEIS|nr:carbonic anhydrase [Leeia speluncae]MCB6184582.1 carbonic anhydrase [Leeia speluncae]
MKDINQFVEGFRAFQQTYFAGEDALFETLAKGQTPETLLIGCCDSRVDPALLTQCAPGEMFVIRNVANLVPECEIGSHHQGVSAGIQFAVCDLGVKRIIVLGHAQCGGIKALMDGRGEHAAPEDYIGKWIGIAEPARQRVKNELGHKPLEVQRRAAELTSILVSLENLLTFPWIKEKVDAGLLTLHGWFFDIEQGALLAYDAKTRHFEALVCPLGQPYHASTSA